MERTTSTSSASPSLLQSSVHQLIVVANRLPVTITQDSLAKGGYSFKASSGGLASALSGCKKKMYVTPLISHTIYSSRTQTGTLLGLVGQVRQYYNLIIILR
jgi:trehalose-6-phosphate synthase